MFIRVADGVRYYVHIEGEGPPVVFLHGFTGSHLTWQPVYTQLKQNYTTIAIDLLGHGLSDKPLSHTRYTIEHTNHDLNYIFKQLKLESVRLVGYSMGGRVALAFALHYPAHINMLILESASPGLHSEMERRARANTDDTLALSIEQKGLEWFADYWGNIPLFKTQKRLSVDTQAKLNQARLNNSSLGLANSLRGIGTGQQPSYWECLEELNKPVTLIVGEEDEKYVQLAKQMDAKLPNSTVFIVQHAGHNVHLEQPDQFIQEVVHVLVQN